MDTKVVGLQISDHTMQAVLPGWAIGDGRQQMSHQTPTESERFLVARGYLAHVTVLWRAERTWSCVATLCSVSAAAIAAGSMWSIGRLVGALDVASARAGYTGPTWGWFFVVAGLLVAGQAVGGLSEVAQARVSARYHEYVLDLVAETAMRPPGIAWLENPDSLARMRRLVDDVRDWLFRTGVDGTWQVLTVRLTGVGALVIAFDWRWWAALLVASAFLLVGRTYVLWISKIYVPPDSDVVLLDRRAKYLWSAVTGGADAKEMRLFGLTDFFAERYRLAALMTDRLMARAWHGAGRPVLASSALMLAVLGGALVLLARDAMSDSISVGSAIAVLQALLAFSAFGPVDDAQTGLTQVASTMRRLEHMRAELALPSRDALESSDTSRPLVSTDQTRVGRRDRAAEVVFDGVTFRYPSRVEPILRGLSLHIRAGQSVAVVGVNGAGKSTLVKLLAGLYDPTAGRVLVDGQDAIAAQKDHRVAVIFQDFVRYPLSLRHNVAYGSLPLLDDESRLAVALERAGATSLLAHLKDGWNTRLSREFNGGSDLSGGQWQRVALGRALAAVEGGAGVLVLDEPTAALDVRAEAALFDRFLAVARGVTTLLVSHRLSSVRHVDRVVVLDAETGVIVEDGSHEELVAAGGQYAEMFHLQASRFALAGERNLIDGDVSLDADSAPAEGEQ